MIYIALAYISLFLLGITDNIRGPLYDEILKEFSLSHLAGSTLFSLSSVFGLMGGLAAPLVLRRRGEAFSLRLGVVLMGASQLIVAFSHAYFAILVAMALLGFSIGFLGVCQNSLVIHHSKPEKLKKLQAGLHSVYGLASFSAPWLIALVYAVDPVWRNVFLSTAGIGLFVLAATFKAPLAQPREQMIAESARGNLFEVVTFSLMLGLYVATEILLSTRIPIYTIESWGADLLVGGWWLSAFFAGLLGGRFLMVFWHPKIRLKNQLLVSLGFSLVLLFIGLWTSWRWALPLTGLTMGPFYPLAMTAVGGLFRGHIYRATSLCFFSSSLMSMGMHTLFGAMTDAFGIQIAMQMTLVYLLIAGALVVFHQRLFGRDYP